MSDQQPTTAPSEQQGRTFFGQPWSLSTIFGVELWERFSFYGMQGILLIYLYFEVSDGGLGIPRDAATSIVGAYGGAVYLATVLGAWLADRLIGAERMLFVSAVTVMLGHIALAVLPGGLGVVVGLILIALGSGGVKATATSIVGTLYAPGDIRRDAGFSLYYLGINLGAFVGPLLTGLLQSTLGFHLGFGLAAVGMAIGLTQYAIGRRHLPAIAAEVPNPLPANRRLPFALAAAVGIAIILVLVVTRLVTEENLSTVVAGLIAVASVAYFATLLSSKRISATERSKVTAFIPLFIASTAFWSLYQQQFTVLTIYSDDRLNRSLFGWEMPISWVQSINPVFIILLSGIFAALWTKLGTRQPSTPVKFSLGTIVMGAAFLLFLPFVSTGAHGTPLLAIVAILFVFTVAELLLSPVGLSASTKLAPELFRTQMVALNFLSVGLGTAIAGTLAGFYDETNEAPYFGISGAIAIILGIALWLGSRGVLALMKGVR